MSLPPKSALDGPSGTGIMPSVLPAGLTTWMAFKAGTAR